MADNNKFFKISDGSFTNDGKFVVKKSLGSISCDEFDKIAEYLDGYLLKIEYVETSTYDNSDDDRVEDSSSRYEGVAYRDIDARNNSEALLRVDGEIKGVVFRIELKYGREVDCHAFFFDGSVQQRMSLGYSASHSSSYTYFNRITLVPKGVDGAPESAGKIRFNQHELYPSI